MNVRPTTTIPALDEASAQLREIETRAIEYAAHGWLKNDQLLKGLLKSAFSAGCIAMKKADEARVDERLGERR